MSLIERKIIVHYHIFKNAGSSVDQLLKKNFPDQWVGFDGDTPGCVITTAELESRINRSEEMIAFSSHQIVPPLPDVYADVYPIVFLRDPIDRIKSAYLFEWKKQMGLDKPKGTFVEFVKQKFSHKRKSSIEEFQTIRMASNNTALFDSGDSTPDDELLSQASEFISTLPFVGIVDQFDRSNRLLAAYLQEGFPDFKLSEVKANVLQDLSLSQDVKRQKIKEELGDELFEMIVERNALDEALYQHGRSCLDSLFNDRFESVDSVDYLKQAG